ncbi:YccS family putative transporter [Variovorax sp. J22P168]|uniref:YccS family putative transporter n=1 Tax=Variovorax jilinensis TaxID=3053513 RepID=UPI00257647F2|nr:YccS family putative transporter [Variovorax sp. J22P168]MDM0014433.1 YccS family putative transporter [Variovorax sp. J22P168]
MAARFLDTLRPRVQAIAFQARAQAIQVLLALGSLMALCALAGRTDAVIPLFLGAIASALAETDDSWRGRMRALVVTLIAFAMVSFSVEATFARPPFFIAGLALAAFWLTMLGAVEARYKSIGYATLVLAMYTTLGMDNQAHRGAASLREPVLLLAGATWYGLLSVLWYAAFPAQEVQSRLVKLYTVLGAYVRYKASLFEPLRDVDIESKRLSLALLNAEVVGALNAAKESIFRRIGARAPSGRLSRYRGLYLIAQDVHERASSSHEDYNAMADAFFHSDLLYRCQRVLDLQGVACERLAGSIARREPFVFGSQTAQALGELRAALDHARARADAPQRRKLLEAVEALARNLVRLDAQLAGASQPSARAGRTEMKLFDRSPRSWHDAAERVRRQLTPRSALFRHALRLSVALAAGYGVMLVIHPAQGYWILLTTLFVCQQTYGETISRMGQRVAGTVLGVIVGWALLQLFPQPVLQSVLAVAAGVLFFATRASRYLLATAAMTVLVLMCFNQVADSDALIVPRLVDTAIGSAIAGLAVLLVLPNWQARRFSEIAATAMRSHAGYLRQIVKQYRSGAVDHLEYRLARRNDHNADAALSTAVADMFREPGFVRPRAGIALRLLIRSHTLLSYLSALGSHRVALPDPVRALGVMAAAESAATALDGLAMGLDKGELEVSSTRLAQEALVRIELGGPPQEVAEDAMAESADGDDASLRLLRTEVNLAWLQIDALRHHAREWLAPESAEVADEDPQAVKPAA